VSRTTITFNPFKISLSNQGNQEGDSGRRYSRDSLEIHQDGPMESKKENNNNNNNKKIQEYSGEIPEIPSGSPPPIIGIRKGNDNWRFRNIYPTDRQIQEILHQGSISPWNHRKTRM
jgi:hypothetical protein